MFFLFCHTFKDNKIQSKYLSNAINNGLNVGAFKDKELLSRILLESSYSSIDKVLLIHHIELWLGTKDDKSTSDSFIDQLINYFKSGHEFAAVLLLHAYKNRIKYRIDYLEILGLILKKFPKNAVLINSIAAIYESNHIETQNKIQELYWIAGKLGFYRGFVNLFCIRLQNNHNAKQSFDEVMVGYQETKNPLLINAYFNLLNEYFDVFEDPVKVNGSFESRPSKFYEYTFLSLGLHAPSAIHLISYIVLQENTLSDLVIEESSNFRDICDLDGLMVRRLLSKYTSLSNPELTPFFGKNIPNNFYLDKNRGMEFNFIRDTDITYRIRWSNIPITIEKMERVVDLFIHELIEVRADFREKISYFYKREKEIFRLIHEN
jgi:hypothetical protein